MGETVEETVGETVGRDCEKRLWGETVRATVAMQL